jgi:hypothetical protein
MLVFYDTKPPAASRLRSDLVSAQSGRMTIEGDQSFRNPLPVATTHCSIAGALAVLV